MVEMKITDRIKGAWNALMHPAEDLNSEGLLEWLGIDSRNKNLISEVTYYTCMKMKRISLQCDQLPRSSQHQKKKDSGKDPGDQRRNGNS